MGPDKVWQILAGYLRFSYVIQLQPDVHSFVCLTFTKLCATATCCMVTGFVLPDVAWPAARSTAFWAFCRRQNALAKHCLARCRKAAAPRANVECAATPDKNDSYETYFGCNVKQVLLRLTIERNPKRSCQTLPGLPRAARPSGRFAEGKTPQRAQLETKKKRSNATRQA